jgi:hypothetical protein
MATYSSASPWFATKQNKTNLEVLNFREIPHHVDDLSYTITAEFANRPDLLAFDLYGNQQLWWVFQNRNPDVIKDSIFDFRAGTTIKLPKKSTLSSALGL